MKKFAALLLAALLVLCAAGVSGQPAASANPMRLQPRLLPRRRPSAQTRRSASPTQRRRRS
jgi:hypothetical protein